MYQCEVQPGETLTSISVREKVSVAVLRRLNGLYGNQIYSGQILNLRARPKQEVKVVDFSSGCDDTVSDIDTSRTSNESKNAPSSSRIESVPGFATSSSQIEKKRLYEMIPSDHTPPVLIGERKILQVEQVEKLRRFLPSMQQIENVRLLYSVLNDGADLDTFFRRCREHKYTLIIVQTMKGEIFGGFNAMEWQTSPNFYGSGDSFLFKFDSEGNLGHYPWTGLNDFFVWCSRSQVAMGGGGDGFGFVLDSDFLTGESFHSATYDNPILVEKENGSFRIANIECWGFEGLFGRISKSAKPASKRFSRG